MKIFKILTVVIAMLLPAVICHAVSYGNTVSVTYGSYRENSTHLDGPDGVCIGNQVIEDSAAVNGGIILGKGQLMVNNPTFNPPIIYLAPATASNTAFATISLSTYSATSNLLPATTNVTLALAGYTDMITPRNLVFLSSSVFSNNAYTRATATVTGVDLFGNTGVTETINFSTSSTTPGYTGIGNRAWSSVTSVSISYSSSSYVGGTPSAILTYMGSGTKIGLPCQLDYSGEIAKVIENGSLSTSYTLSLPYNTITFNSAPNGTSNYQVYALPQMR